MTDIQNCIFCKIARGEIPATVVHQDDEFVAFRDIAPAAPTHILIIPREHIASAAEVDEAHGPIISKMMALAVKIARSENIAESGFRVVTNVGKHGGQSVFHLHFHLLGGRHMSWPPG